MCRAGRLQPAQALAAAGECAGHPRAQDSRRDEGSQFREGSRDRRQRRGAYGQVLEGDAASVGGVSARVMIGFFFVATGLVLMGREVGMVRGRTILLVLVDLTT